MSVTIQCDGRVEVKIISREPNWFQPLVLATKHADIKFCRNEKCNLSFEMTVGELKPMCCITISTKTDEKHTSSYASFDFPYEMRKVALDTFGEIAEAMSSLGMLDLSSQRVE